MNSKPKRVAEDNVGESSAEYHAKFVAPRSSEGEVAQTGRDQLIARQTDELAKKNALFEQAEADVAEGKR